MTINERYRKFHQWQIQPADYKESTDVHRCNNCEQEFRGNYCPTCGQKWDTGPVSWSNLRQQWMDQWGLGTRSLLLTIVQLLLRPGYLIGEYISGKRRNCFPPISMLVLVGLVVSIVGKWVGLFYAEESEIAHIENPTPIDKFSMWIGSNMDYGPLFFFLLLVVPTFIIFRYAPRHTRHTLPQSFFIQVFYAIQFILLMLIYGLGCKMLKVSDEAEDIAKVVFYLVLTPSFLFVNYKQLFGYGVWGTIWRTLACFIIMIYTFILILGYANVILYDAEVRYLKTENVCLSAIKIILTIIFILCGATAIKRRGYSRRGRIENSYIY